MPLDPAPRAAINIRSVTLGLCGVVLICALTPYNDYALNNTFLVGNNLPIGVMMLTFLFAIFVNGPLSRWFPKHAFTSGEVTVAFAMTLVSCALPSSGLMRGFPASLVVPFNEAGSDEEFLRLLESLGLPHWLFPSFAGAGPRQWANDPIVQGFVGRWTSSGAIPYFKWTIPIFAWAIFTFALYGALLCMMTIVRRQWFVNERLPFPLAQVQLSLIEQPARGSWLNEVMRSRSFWIAFFAVFSLHIWNGLAHYYPKHFPEIWLWYNFERLMTEPPWVYADPKLKDAAVFFSAVGATYFVSGSVAFSLWFFFILNNIARFAKGSATGDPDNYGVMDEHVGGLMAFLLMILWIGRHHWRLVIAQAFRGVREGEQQDRYLSHATAFWGMISCATIMTVFLWLAGMTSIGAAATVLLVLSGFLIITRIIAESGLIHGQIYLSFLKPWTLIASYAKAGAWLHPVPVKTFYLGAMIEVQHYDFREVMPIYATHGMKIADQTIFEKKPEEADDSHARGAGRKLIALLALSLIVGYFTSFYSMLWTEYHFSFTKDVTAKMPINDHGAQNLPRGKLVMWPVSYDKGQYSLKHDPASHIGFGFLFTGLLAFLRLRFPWWPLHPIGFLMIGTFPGAHLWLSIFVGWLAKTMIVRFGGPGLYMRAKPFFLGLIVGESAAAGFWLLMGILMSLLGLPYRTVNIMPG